MSECHEKHLKASQYNVLASGGYSKWCRVKIYEVGKAHLGIVPRIVFDPSRPLRKPHNPTLITVSTTGKGVGSMQGGEVGGQAVIF